MPKLTRSPQGGGFIASVALAAVCGLLFITGCNTNHKPEQPLQ